MKQRQPSTLDRRELSSSVVIRGLDATTFAQMEDFVNDLEGLPLERLLHDLPNLARLSPTKFALVSYVVAGKFRNATAGEKQWMRDSVQATFALQNEKETQQRIGRILERLK